MISKRGLTVVLVLLFVLASVSFSFATEDKSKIFTLNDNKYTSIGGHYEESGADFSCDNKEVFIEWKYSKGQSIPKKHEDDCSLDVPRIKAPATEGGCWFIVMEHDGDGDDDGAWAKLDIGTIFDSSTFCEPHNLASGWDQDWFEEYCYDDNDAYDCVLDYNFKSNTGLICAQDHFWHECKGDKSTGNSNGDLNSVTWANNHLFSCTKNKETNDNPVWKDLGQDKDRDFYSSDSTDPKKKDCADDPKDDLPICKETSGVDDPLTLCADKKYSTCSYCRNPGAKEIAGDKVDNDCIGGDVADPDDNEKACTDKNLNLDDKSYFWMSDANKNEQCCGDDVDDFGKIFETTSGNKMLCLPIDKNKVSTFEGDIEKTVKAFMDPKSQIPCNGKWCAPLMSSLPFHIFTIKQPGKETYDIVSNGDIWQKCNQENQQPTLTKPIGEKAKVANGFSCYQEGDRWSWVYCKAKAENEKIEDAVDNGIKNRVEGDGLCV